MKEVNTTPGKYQVVRSENGCTVTQILDNGQRVEDNVPAGESTAVFAFTSRIEVDDDSAVVREVFKLAPQQKLALLGVLGGNDGLPAGYTAVEWLDCERNVIQYIETPVYVDKDCEIFAIVLGESQITICRTNNLNKSGLLTQTQIWTGTTLGSWWGESPLYEGINTNGIKPGEKNEIKNSATGMYYNGKFVPRDKPSSAAALTKTTFFCLSILEIGYKGAKIYECAITKNGKDLFRGIPCLDKTGSPCMFDLVSRKPFYNAGVSDFLYPGKESEVSTFSLRRPVTYAQLTESGVRRLYRVPSGYNGTKEEYAAEHGFKPLVETPMPEEGYWVPQWRETEEEIVLDWVETEPPTEDYLTQPTE